MQLPPRSPDRVVHARYASLKHPISAPPCPQLGFVYYARFDGVRAQNTGPVMSEGSQFSRHIQGQALAGKAVFNCGPEAFPDGMNHRVALYM